MKKESGTLSGVGTIYITSKEIEGEFYIKVSDFTRCIKELEEGRVNLSELNRKQSKAFKETMKDYRGLLRDYMKIGEENKKLKERIDELEKCNLNLQERLDRKEELNKSYRKEIKEHQLYEEKLEHRIVEFEELLHGE